MFSRIEFVQSYLHRLEDGVSTLLYQAGHFYHVAEDLAKELIEKGIARLDGAGELAKADAAATEKAVQDGREFLGDLVAGKQDATRESSTGADVSATEGSAAEQHETAPLTPEHSQ